MRLQTSLHPALDLYHRAEEIQEELVALYTRAADTTLRVLDLSLQTLSKETSQIKRKLREMESYPPLVELQQQSTELIRKIERIRDKEAQKLEDQKGEDALKVQLESVRAAAAAHPHSSSTTAVSTPPGSRHLSLASKIKLEVPKFNGNPLHWFQFWGDFEELIASNTSLTNIEKFTYFNQALLTPESQKIAAEAGGPRKNFDKSVKALKASYEDKRLIYQRSVQKFVETGHDLGLNRKHLAAVLLAPAQDTAWPGAMATETGASKERMTWSRPTICVTTAFKLATESLPAPTKEPVESAKGGTTPLCMIQPRW